MDAAFLKPTNEELGSKGAAGHSQVMSVLLSVQQTRLQIPEFQVSVGAAAHKHLPTGREAAGHNTGLTHNTATVHRLD